MKLVIIGVGKMGGAVLEGALQAGLLEPHEVGIIEPFLARAQDIQARYGVQLLNASDDWRSRYVLMSVKPQSFAEAAANTARKADAYISLMAGTTTATLAQGLQSERVVRVMPNLGASIGQSATALCHLAASPEDIDFASALFRSVGKVFPIPESLIDPFTGIAGSGPAFVALFAEALADGAVRVGFSREQARAISTQMLLGSSMLLQDTEASQLKNDVCSAGGTSIAGVMALESEGFRYSCMKAVEAASERARELS